MKLPCLHNGKIIKRYKRFLADIELDSGEQVTAHCPNTGAMTGCWQPGAAAQLCASDNPKRKLNWTLERVDMGSGWIGINTSRVNRFIVNFIQAQQVEVLTGYDKISTEPDYSPEGYDRSRFDVLLSASDRRNCYVEIKNTTLFKDDQIQFPDAVTSRGRKHLVLLKHAAQSGHRAVILFAVNRPEGFEFAIAKDIDPEYYQQLIESHKAGVEILPLRVIHTDDGVEAGEVLPFVL